MVKRMVFHPDHEVIGQMISDFRHAIGSQDFQALIEKYGYDKVDTQQWYPMQDFLDFIEELEHSSGGSLNLVSIGLSMAANGVFPPEFDKMPVLEVLKLSPIAYPLNNRGSNIGSIDAEIIHDSYVKLIVRNPHSDDSIYGTIYGMMKRFAIPKGFLFKVYYDPLVPRREQGGEETIIHIQWWEKEAPSKTQGAN